MVPSSMATTRLLFLLHLHLLLLLQSSVSWLPSTSASIRLLPTPRNSLVFSRILSSLRLPLYLLSAHHSFFVISGPCPPNQMYSYKSHYTIEPTLFTYFTIRPISGAGGRKGEYENHGVGKSRLKFVNTLRMERANIYFSIKKHRFWLVYTFIFT